MATKRDLYSLPILLDPIKRQQFETDFLQIIDDRAARLIKEIVAAKAIDPSEYGAVTQFVLSLMYRTPAQLERIKDKLRSRVSDETKREAELLHYHAVDLLGQNISSEPLNDALLDLTPTFVELGHTDLSFFLTDSPVLMSNGVKMSTAFLLLPLTPRLFLCLCRPDTLVDRFGSLSPRNLARGVNRALTRQADHFVISASASPERFIEKHFEPQSNEVSRVKERFNGLVHWSLPDEMGNLELVG